MPLALLPPSQLLQHNTQTQQAWINSLVDMEEDEDMEMAFDMDDAE